MDLNGFALSCGMTTLGISLVATVTLAAGKQLAIELRLRSLAASMEVGEVISFAFSSFFGKARLASFG